MKIKLPREVINKIEEVRKELLDIVGDDIFARTRMSSATSKLWILSHKKEWDVSGDENEE